MRYQQLSGENLPDFIKLTAVVNGLKGNVRHFVLLSLDGDSSFGDLDSLLGKYFNNTYVQSESSLNNVWDKPWRDKQKGKSKGKGKKPNPYYKQKLDKGGKGKEKKGKEKERQTSPKEKKGKLSLPSLQPTKARGSSNFQKETSGAMSAARKGTAPKLAGGTPPTSSSNSSTNKNKLGTTQANSSNGLHSSK